LQDLHGTVEQIFGQIFDELNVTARFREMKMKRARFKPGCFWAGKKEAYVEWNGKMSCISSRRLAISNLSLSRPILAVDHRPSFKGPYSAFATT